MRGLAKRAREEPVKRFALPVLSCCLAGLAGAPAAVAQARPDVTLSVDAENHALASAHFESSRAVRGSRIDSQGTDPVVNDTWKGGTGNWSTAANWSAGVPNNGAPAGTTYNVFI